jgi:lauroyl/myristoyl acyltransferase
LSKKEILMIAGDGLRSTQFVELSLFEKPYPFPTGFIRLAQMADAIVIPVFALPDEEEGSIRVDIHDPLPIKSDRTIEENLRLFAEVLGKKLNESPHLWHRWDRPNWFAEASWWAAEVGSRDPFRSRRKAPKQEKKRSIAKVLARRVREALRAEPG